MIGSRSPILFELHEGTQGPVGLGMGPFRPTIKQLPVEGSYLYPDAFRLPALPRPIPYFVMKNKTLPIRMRTIPLPPLGVTITGVSRDSAGVALGGVTCTLFRRTDNAILKDGVGTVRYTQVATTVSDGSGNYSFVVGFDGPYRVTFDLDGAPIRAGISLNTLAGV